MNDRVTVTMNEGVADVRLVRTDKMNALDDAMFAALRRAAQEHETSRRDNPHMGVAESRSSTITVGSDATT